MYCALTWSQSNVQCVHHSIVINVGNVDQHPETIHLPHHPLNEINTNIFKRQYIL